MKDRIKSLRRIPASKLVPHPKNHREHPDRQKRVLSGLLEEIGWTTGLIVRETKAGYQILDGHLRQQMTTGKVPCLVVDLTDDEADLLLASHDAVTGMAEVNQNKLDDLLATLSAKNPDVQEMLEQLATNTSMALDEGKEFDESCADDVATVTCPSCGEVFPL
ncbi:MAG: ParB N-terminal domain-containing protein [Planctomycetaceae bacterium]